MHISLHESKAQLSGLIDRVLDGEEIVITRHGRPVVRLVAANAPGKQRPLGLMRGKIRIAKDFDAELPATELALFEGA